MNLRLISISKTSKINHIAWEEIKLIFELVFANSLTKIIVCNGITQYPTTAFEKISPDIVVLLPETKSGNLYILTLQDNFTKYSLAIPLPNHQAGTIADAFVKKFICIFGSPKGVLTDQGRDFYSNLLKRLAKRFRIKQFRTTAFHSQSNGSLQRSHHVLGEYLKQFVAKNSEWDEPSREPLSQNEKYQTYDNYLINFVTQVHEMRT